MTSQKSSNQLKSPVSTFRFTFARALSGNFLMPLLNMIALTLFFCVLPMQYLKSLNGEALKEGGKLADTLKFILLPNAEMISILPLFAIVGSSILLGVFMFRFIADKKTVNVFYSLGITRKNIFLSKYLAGAVMLLISIAVPVLADAMINIAFIGSSAQLWSAALYYLFGLYFTAMVCYTVTAAIFSAVGTITEGLVFSTALLLSPSILLYCVQSLMGSLVWGCEHRPGGISLVSEYAAFNPVLFMNESLASHSALDGAGKMNSMLTYPQAYVAPNFATILPWIALIAVALVAALFLFQRRKAEISGFLGKNIVLNSIVGFCVAFTGFSIAVSLNDKIGTVACVIAGLLVYVILYSVVELILLRDFKAYIKGLVKLPVHLAVAMLCFSLFATGFFGYENRMPELADVKEASISSVADISLYGDDYYGGYSTTMYDFLALQPSGDVLGKFTTDKDKEFIKSLHQKLIKGKAETKSQPASAVPVTVRYTLKDGSTLIRRYRYTTEEALKQALTMYETDWSKQTLADAIAAEPEAPDTSGHNQFGMQQESVENLAFGYQTGTVYLQNNTTAKKVELTREQHQALKQALIADIQAQTTQQKYFPEQPANGSIAFYIKDEGEETASFPVSNLFSSPNAKIFPLTADMKHTLQFLADNGLTELLAASAQPVEKASVAPIGQLYDQFYSYPSNGRNLSSMFRIFSMQYSRETSRDYDDQAPSLEITAKQLEEIKPHLYSYYYTGGDGYAVFLQNSDGSRMTLYLPEQYAPQWIKNTAAK